MKEFPERFAWALSLINPEPHHKILEIGGGAGLLADLLSSELTTGTYLGIDKSRAMTGKAIKRNQKHIDRNVASFIAADFASASLPRSLFDIVAAFNVNFFWKDGAGEFRQIRRCIDKTGKLFVFYQAPYDISISAAAPVRDNLIGHSFEILDIKHKKLKPTSAFCIIARLA